MTRRSLMVALGLLAASWATAAPAADVSAEIGLTSDYRYRGLTLSDGRPALQASIMVEHRSGAYLTAWGSTIRDEDQGTSAEIDLSAGYATQLSDALGLDLAATYYAYPSDAGSNYFEATATATIERGPASASFGVSLIPAQEGTRDEGGRARSNRYVFAGLGYQPVGTSVTLSAGLGHERGYFDEVENGGKWDWTLAGEVDVRTMTLGIAYVGCSAGNDGDHQLVGTLLFHF